MTVPRAMTAAIIGLPTKESEGGSFLAGVTGPSKTPCASSRQETRNGLSGGIPVTRTRASLLEALFGTRTGDPLLTMEVLYQLS